MSKNRACPKCREVGRDSKGDHLFLMEDGLTWFCNRSGIHSDGKVYKEVGGMAIDLDAEAQVIGSMKELTAIVAEEVSLETVKNPYRGIQPATYAKYEVKGEYDEGNLLSLQHDLYSTEGKVVTQKVRKLPKDFFTVDKTKGVKLKLFGQKQLPSAKRLLITEGELDAMSAYQMLHKYRVAVWSLPVGANSKAIVDNLEDIQKFTQGHKELYFCLDNDEAGKKLSRELATMFPRSKHMKLDMKDANEYLEAGRGDDFVDSFWSASIYKPDTIVRVEDILEKVTEEPVVGRSWPWPTLTDTTYGRRDGEGIYVGAGVKLGKSEFINEVIAHDVKNGWPIAVCKYEEPPAMTVKRVAGKLDGKFYHRPGEKYNKDDLIKTAKSIHPHLFMYPAFGPATWDSTKSFVTYAVAMGCKTIIIDPLTKLTNHLDSSETETLLRKLSDEIACMAQDMGFFYIITCHLKAPSSGPPHELGGMPMSNQFRGSRAMMENTYYQMGIQRNKSTDLTEAERNTSTFHLLEDRNFGNAVKFPVFYDKGNQSYLEPTGGIF